SLRKAEWRGQGDRMIETVVASDAKCLCDLLRCLDAGPLRLRSLVSTERRSSVVDIPGWRGAGSARRSRLGQPTVVGVCDDHLSVGELQFVAGAPELHGCGEGDPGRTAVHADDLIADP